jgi:hypothetical protein
MKKLILTSILTFFFTFNLNAQGNLEFNRAIKQSGTVAGFSTLSITVPINKIWKITTGSIYANVSNCTLLLGQHIIAYYFSSTTATNHNLTCNLPLWLPQGTYLISLNFSNTATSGYYSYSGIEFNIVP